jgi:hypothetical protein
VKYKRCPERFLKKVDKVSEGHMDKESLLSIGRPQKLCLNCNNQIDMIERHPSTLRHDRDEGVYERQDYCPDCWDYIKNDLYESFWITKRDLNRRKIPKLSRRERSTAIRALFESVWDRRESEDVDGHLFFLAHLLMKWGGLKWKRNHTDEQGQEFITFEDRASGDMLEIRSVEVLDERILAIREEIKRFLQNSPPDSELVL